MKTQPAGKVAALMVLLLVGLPWVLRRRRKWLCDRVVPLALIAVCLWAPRATLPRAC